MIRKKDPFWEYGENMKGRFQCKFCQKDFPGGIARLKSHLSRLRGRDVAICHSVPEDVRVLALQDIRSQEEYLNKRRRLSTFMIAEENGVKLPVTPTTLPISPTTSSPYSSPRLHQTELLAVCSKEDKEAEEKIVKDEEPGDKMVKDNESVDKMVAQAFMMNGIAANVVKSPSFISMIKAIAEYGSGYSLPSCATLSTKLLRDVRKEVNEYVSAIKASWSLTGCTLMSDTWTDSESHSFITLIAYSPKGAVFLKSFESTDSTIAGDFLEDILLSIVDEIGSENVVQIIVNKVSCGEYAMDLVAENYPHIYRTKCASHGFQQMLEDIYENVEWIQSAFDDAKSIVDYLYKYPLVLKSMQVHKPDKELKRPCETTCASYFVMLQSLLDFEDCLRTIVVSPEWSVMNESKTPRGNTIVQLIQSLDFWNRGKEVIASLEPLISVLHLVDGEGSTAGYLYEAMERVRVEFKQRCSNDESKFLKLLKIFDSRRGDIVHKIHAAASFLNPSLMYDGKIKYEQPDIRDGMNYVVEHMVCSNEMDDFISQLLLYNGKSSKLFNTLSVLMMKKAHPRVWWEYNGSEVPLLRKVAIRILSQPCSSSLCGRKWSAYEVARTMKANNSPESTFEEIVYTRMNMMMMASYRDLEMQDKFAINLEKQGEHPEDIHNSCRKSKSIIHINGDALTLDEVSDLESSP